jgi:ribosomal protein S27AE
MRFFYVSDTVRHLYCPTLSDAHKAAKEPMSLTDGSGFRRDWVRIEEVEVPADKAGVLLLLNGAERNEETLRRWTLTLRGGLRESPSSKCPTCGTIEFADEGDRFRCDCGATWFKEAQ